MSPRVSCRSRALAFEMMNGLRVMLERSWRSNLFVHRWDAALVGEWCNNGGICDPLHCTSQADAFSFARNVTSYHLIADRTLLI